MLEMELRAIATNSIMFPTTNVTAVIQHHVDTLLQAQITPPPFPKPTEPQLHPTNTDNVLTGVKHLKVAQRLFAVAYREELARQEEERKRGGDWEKELQKSRKGDKKVLRNTRRREVDYTVRYGGLVEGIPRLRRVDDEEVVVKEEVAMMTSKYHGIDSTG